MSSSAECIDGLTERQTQAIPVVLGSATLRAGLEAANLHRSTWYRWLSEPPFRTAVDTARREASDEALTDLRAGIRFAVTSLLGLVASKNEAVRLSACRTVLELAQRGVEAEELAGRLARIEAALIPTEARP